METENVEYKSEEIIEICDSPVEIKPDIIDPDFLFVSSSSQVQDEPIDLTYSRPKITIQNQIIATATASTSKSRIIIQPKPETRILNFQAPILPEKGFKRKIETQTVSEDDYILPSWSLTPVTTPQIINFPSEALEAQKPRPYSYAIVHQPHQDVSTQLKSRHQDVLKMAKSIFSKRTRTLYHWMYPAASKQQIKQVVSSTWDSMAVEEKNIYVAQVLGRFGYVNANLMVNPQLGQIKELPPAPQLHGFNPKASELQNAISSITNEKKLIESCSTADFQPRKRARISKERAAPVVSIPNACQEFDDDPELTQELAQFSLMFKNQF